LKSIIEKEDKEKNLPNLSDSEEEKMSEVILFEEEQSNSKFIS